MTHISITVVNHETTIQNVSKFRKFLCCYKIKVKKLLPAALHTVHSANISVTRAQFTVFCPAGVTCCTNWGKIWPNFIPLGAGVGVWAPKIRNVNKI